MKTKEWQTILGSGAEGFKNVGRATSRVIKTAGDNYEFCSDECLFKDVKYCKLFSAYYDDDYSEIIEERRCKACEGLLNYYGEDMFKSLEQKIEKKNARK